MADFDNLNPPGRVTNPSPDGKSAAVMDREYPRHMHAKDGSYVVVQDDKDKAKRIKEGFKLQPWTASAEDDD